MGESLLSRITVEPGKCGGRPCIRGHRMRVSDIVELLEGGDTRLEILADYPWMEPDDIEAAVQYAATQAGHVVLKTT